MIPSGFARRSAVAALLPALLGACKGPEMVERPAFDSTRAWSYLGQQVAYGPRTAGDRGQRATLDWMEQHLRFRADTVWRQPHQHVDGEATWRFENLYARFRPELETRVLLVAHFDTHRRGSNDADPARRGRPVPGANDNASGVAVLMELAELFRQQPPPIGVDMLLTDGDDYSEAVRLMGVRHWLANRPAGPAPRYAIVVARVGDLDPRFPRWAGAGADSIAARIWTVAGEMGLDTVWTADGAGAIPEGTHSALAAAGIPVVAVYDPEHGAGNRIWRTMSDHLPNTDSTSLRKAGDVLAEHLYRGG